jgi:thiaminase
MSFLLRSSPDEWKGYVRHPFVLQLGKGTLPVECFRHYIIQDWHYLRHCESEIMSEPSGDQTRKLTLIVIRLCRRQSPCFGCVQDVGL